MSSRENAKSKDGKDPLDFIFAPRTVAVIGASEKEDSVGKAIFWNLLQNSSERTIFPVNPKHKQILNIKAYPSVLELPEKIDLAIIVTPAETVPSIVEQCGEVNIPAVIIISAGFAEMGLEGKERENRIRKVIKEKKIRVVGPNCLGVMKPSLGLNATFASDMAIPGSIGFLSQSGALCSAILDWSLKKRVGFSSFISVGGMIDIQWGDLLRYMEKDPHTKSILMYMESLPDPTSFLQAAKELTKPLIILKSGRTEESSRVAVSHTGSLAGNDEVFSAAVEGVNGLRVDSIEEFYDIAEALSKQPFPKGPHLAVVTNGGGVGVVATDALIQAGGVLATLSRSSVEQLNQILPSSWSHGNPVDLLGAATAEQYMKGVEVVARDPQCDGILVLLTPQFMTHATEVAEKLSSFAQIEGKPIFACWMGAKRVEEGEKILSSVGIPSFSFPEGACQCFTALWRQHSAAKAFFEEVPLHMEAFSLPKAREVFQTILHKTGVESRFLLTELESKKILEAYGIPCVPTFEAASEEESVALAKKIGFPVVMKVLSTAITHKKKVGGVLLNLLNEEAVRQGFRDISKRIIQQFGKERFQGVTLQPMVDSEGYELILGSKTDRDFGPVLLFGSGGQWVEVFKDFALALPPLHLTMIQKMLEKIRVYPFLRQKIDLLFLEKILLCFSQFIVDNPQVEECDINPLFVAADQIIALDARIVLHKGT